MLVWLKDLVSKKLVFLRLSAVLERLERSGRLTGAKVILFLSKSDLMVPSYQTIND